MAPHPETMAVEVVYARPDCQRVVAVPLGAGMTALEAVQASGLLAEFPELDPASLALGIFGRRVEGSQRLDPDDRVEIYRSLHVDPRAARRRAAASESGRGRRRKESRSP